MDINSLVQLHFKNVNLINLYTESGGSSGSGSTHNNCGAACLKSAASHGRQAPGTSHNGAGKGGLTANGVPKGGLSGGNMPGTNLGNMGNMGMGGMTGGMGMGGMGMHMGGGGNEGITVAEHSDPTHLIGKTHTATKMDSKKGKNSSAWLTVSAASAALAVISMY